MSEEFCMDCGRELAMKGYEKLIKELADERDELRAEVGRVTTQRNTALEIAKKLMVYGIEGSKCIAALQALEKEVQG